MFPIHFSEVKSPQKEDPLEHDFKNTGEMAIIKKNLDFFNQSNEEESFSISRDIEKLTQHEERQSRMLTDQKRGLDDSNFSEIDEELKKKIDLVLESDDEKNMVPYLKSKDEEEITAFKNKLKRMILLNKISKLDDLESFFIQVLTLNDKFEREFIEKIIHEMKDEFFEEIQQEIQSAN